MLKRFTLFFLIFFQNTYAESHKPQEFLDAIAGKADEGMQIVQHYCLNCHAKKPIIPLGAPPMQDKKAWDVRIKQGFDLLFEHADNGLRAMPARGGCFECNDEQLMLAILALIPEDAQSLLIKELKDSKKYNKLKKIIEKAKLIHNSPDN